MHDRPWLLIFVGLLILCGSTAPAPASCDPPCPGEVCCADGTCVSTVSACNTLGWQQLEVTAGGDRAQLLLRGRFLDPGDGFQAQVMLTTRDPDVQVNGPFDCRSPVDAEMVCTDRRGTLRFTLEYRSLAPFLLLENLTTDEAFHLNLSRVALAER